MGASAGKKLRHWQGSLLGRPCRLFLLIGAASENAATTLTPWAKAPGDLPLYKEASADSEGTTLQRNCFKRLKRTRETTSEASEYALSASRSVSEVEDSFSTRLRLP